MKQNILYLFTRTPLHVGAGSSVGAIDLPVQRERHSRHPIIPGSSIKGVLRATCTDDSGDVLHLFGPDLSEDKEAEAKVTAQAGDLSFGEARPIAFPVRSAKGSFAYITCPIALQRWAREAGVELSPLENPKDQHCLAGDKVKLAKGHVVLEEYAFEASGEFPPDWEEALKALSTDPVWQEAPGRLVLLSDGDFSHFVATTCEVSNHNKIDVKTGAVAKGALFNIESVPAETLFFAPVVSTGRYKEKNVDSQAGLEELVQNHPVLQFGGHNTTGLGFCSLTLISGA